ncbi:MAG: S24 family peptidase [Micavibrio sp.]|nr:S24 family peptidase [Micavibrio sp.]
MTAPRIHERVKQVLDDTPGLTQKGLAAHMGLNPANVNRMLHGIRAIKAEEIPVIEEYLGVRLDLQYPQETKPAQRRGFAEGAAVFDAPQPVPVYGYAAGSGDIGKKDSGLNLANGDIIDWVARHPAQNGVPHAFAIYVFSDSMEPRYYRGELVYVHPSRPVEVNRDCVIRMKNGDAFIKQLVRLSERKIRIRQFNPPLEKEMPLDDIEAVYAVIGRG